MTVMTERSQIVRGGCFIILFFFPLLPALLQRFFPVLCLDVHIQGVKRTNNHADKQHDIIPFHRRHAPIKTKSLYRSCRFCPDPTA